MSASVSMAVPALLSVPRTVHVLGKMQLLINTQLENASDPCFPLLQAPQWGYTRKAESTCGFEALFGTRQAPSYPVPFIWPQLGVEAARGPLPKHILEPGPYVLPAPLQTPKCVFRSWPESPGKWGLSPWELLQEVWAHVLFRKQVIQVAKFTQWWKVFILNCFLIKPG